MSKTNNRIVPELNNQPPSSPIVQKIKSVVLHHADVGYQQAKALLPLALNHPFNKKTQDSKNDINQPKPQIKKKKRVLPPNT